MYEYNGFAAKIWQENEKWHGIVFGLDIRFEGKTEADTIAEFHRIADEHMPEPD